MRIYKRLLVAIVWIMFIFAAFEYYSFKQTESEEPQKNVIVVVETRNVPKKKREISNGYENSKTIRSKVVKKNIVQTTARAKDVVAVTAKHDSLDVEAEKDSHERIMSVNKVCPKLKATTVLIRPTGPKDRKKLLDRYNLFHHILVNEKYKVLYCFIPKVGCSNMKRIFVVMEGLYPSVEKVDHSKLNKEVVRLDNKKFTEEQRQFMLKSFYKFMIVRDPFERLVSAYRNKWQNPRNTELHANLGRKIIEKYRYNNTKKAETGDDMTFTEYSRYLIDNPSWDVNEHWMPYEDLCRPCDVKYDFIGSIETLARDVTHTMRQINANQTKYHMIKIRKPLVETKKATASFLKELTQKYFNQLLANYQTDFELFGYSIPKYDKLDQRYPA